MTNRAVSYRLLHQWERLRIGKGEAGFTLLELLVVLGILALLASFAAPQVQRYMGQARTESARTQLAAISTALELYALDNSGYPSQQAGLALLIQPPQGATRWRGPYLKKAEGLIDPWGRPYVYRFPTASGGYQVFTLGRDNAPGGTGEDQDLAQ
jgi:general secretion pathway protein G